MDLLLILVAYHPGAAEVGRLTQCLDRLSPEIGYGVVVNDYHLGEPVEKLASRARFFVTESTNLGYGRAFNRGLDQLNLQGLLPKWVAALNTDLTWIPGTFETMTIWLESQSDIVLAVPQITDPQGIPQQLCKRDPTVLALFSRRFVPDHIKPQWLKRYDKHFVMADYDSHTVFDVSYLSGCCMVFRTLALRQIGGFDPRFFLYLEDADLTRSLRSLGRCVHMPLVSVQHSWGRGSYRSWWLALVTLHSAWMYFRKWGLQLW